MKDPNENRLGYKKTPVGWIPANWGCELLENIAERVTGHTPNKKEPQFWNGGIKWVSLADSNKLDRPIIFNTFKMISEKGIDNSSARLLPKGTVILLRDAAVGKSTILGERMAVSQHFVGWVCKNQLNNRYLYYYLQNKKREFIRIAFGSTIVTIGMGYFKKLLVPIPNLSEQRSIAEIIFTWDSAIDQTRRLIDAKTHRRKALMQQLLMGKKRLPRFQQKKEHESYRYFDLPTDWDCPQIKEIAWERSERNSGNNDFTVLSCSKHKGFVESSLYFGKQVFSEDTSNYKIIRRGWFGYPSNHIEEGSIGLLNEHEKGLVSPIYTVFECSEKIVPEYLFAVFKTDTFRHIFSVATNASVDRRGSLRWKIFSLIRVPLPERNEQQAIADVLEIADSEIAELNRKLKSLETQKRGLMQKLLTGEVRVKP